MTQAWCETTQVYFSPSTPAKHAVFVNSYTGSGPAENAWALIDLKPWGIEADAKWVMLSGILIITHGTVNEIANLEVAFRKPGDLSVTPDMYCGQCCETSQSGGQRSTMSTVVPLLNGCVEMYWSRSAPGTWPEHPAYGINLHPMLWGR
jgi:hypothetical protein